jgi:hypothetical protein
MRLCRSPPKRTADYRAQTNPKNLHQTADWLCYAAFDLLANSERRRKPCRPQRPSAVRVRTSRLQFRPPIAVSRAVVAPLADVQHGNPQPG